MKVTTFEFIMFGIEKILFLIDRNSSEIKKIILSYLESPSKKSLIVLDTLLFYTEIKNKKGSYKGKEKGMENMFRCCPYYKEKGKCKKNGTGRCTYPIKKAYEAYEIILDLLNGKNKKEARVLDQKLKELYCPFW